MISITATTGNYILQPALVEKHKNTLDWLSSTLYWKGELAFFQKLLDQHASQFVSLPEKKQIDHFQNLILYYNGEVVDEFRKKLREHERHLAEMLSSKNESDTKYYKEHDAIMDDLDTFSIRFSEFKKEFTEFIEKAL